MPMYDPSTDYRRYQVKPQDAPYLSTTQAAQRLGVGTSQAVRSMVRRGVLPARREARGYNPPYLIPQWAVEGYASVRNGSLPTPFAKRDDERVSARLRTLEDALAAVREAREHEQRALALQIEAAEELAAANGILHGAVTGVLVPPTVGNT